ncbi:methyltransferase domain-containing protein [Bacillus sp. ISL-40]|uniref:class I SAM-dependent methyltransferase n=1 Tax=unclassified Bacillus (in: firmicutes) TaxID=185979 RepID=UPI001BEA7903|nr:MULTISPECIES: class I SAM-dependent methyltransferase [unclassified Bacillus (in: firmicutes)]MBT2699703.1 methyltransferase domain-containing protein [Bacillus sp. ISL-40]MBT2744323.1 methyltransferase domain-containing protein [Bacillus sp. ISL-77]
MDIKKDVQQQFGKSADSYVSSAIHKDGNDLQKLLEMAMTTGEEELLDVATGGGHTANAFASCVKKVTALDLTPEMLVAAQKYILGNGHQNVEFKVGDAEILPFPDGLFDIVTCRIAPHHFPDVNKFVEEVHRVLKPSGQFLLDDNVVPEEEDYDLFYNTIEKWRDYSHFRAWKKSEWLQMLEISGFEIFEWHRFEKTFHYEPWCDRMNLPEDEKDKLTQFILSASPKVKEKFKITIRDNQIISFVGEAVILRAIKR